MSDRSNWAGNYTYSSTGVHFPKTVEELQKIVSHASTVKALGSRHSFNDIADSTGDQVSLEQFDVTSVIDPERRTLTVHGGVKYGHLCEQLHRAGYALHNMASLPHISVAGACATATHGSGDANGNLATAVSSIEFVTAGGDLEVLSRDKDGDRFCGAVVGLGALGIVTGLTLNILPAFDMRQDVYENLPFAQVESHFDSIESSAYSVSLFTDWRSDRFTQIWLKRIVAEGSTFETPPELSEATPAPANRHPIGGLPAEPCTLQMGVPGPWYARLPHFRMEFTPSSGNELQTEYLVPRPQAVQAIKAVDRMRERIAPLLLVSEIRTIAADDLWMSPCYRQACVGIHFTWTKDWDAVRQLLPLIEGALEPFDARPHWGKLFTMPAQRVQSLYPKLPAFQQLLRDYDPHGKFRNAFLDTYVGG
jgi:xylitol oxidase